MGVVQDMAPERRGYGRTCDSVEVKRAVIGAASDTLSIDISGWSLERCPAPQTTYHVPGWAAEPLWTSSRQYKTLQGVTEEAAANGSHRQQRLVPGVVHSRGVAHLAHVHLAAALGCEPRYKNV